MVTMGSSGEEGGKKEDEEGRPTNHVGLEDLDYGRRVALRGARVELFRPLLVGGVTLAERSLAGCVESAHPCLFWRCPRCALSEAERERGKHAASIGGVEAQRRGQAIVPQRWGSGKCKGSRCKGRRKGDEEYRPRFCVQRLHAPSFEVRVDEVESESESESANSSFPYFTKKVRDRSECGGTPD